MSIINLINSNSYFSVINSLRRIMLIRIINSSSSSSSSTRLAREDILYIIITFKVIKIIKYRRIKIIKKTLISRSQLR